MATIRPFRPIRPNPLHINELVFAKLQAESAAGLLSVDDGLQSLKVLLEGSARVRPETPEGQSLAYVKIRETLRVLLGSERLLWERTPGLYVYEVVHRGRRQTGIWALTALEDYRNGTIRIHEHTLDESVRRLKNYREHTSLEGSPILLTYRTDKAIDKMITDVKMGAEKAVLRNHEGLHRIWKVDSAEYQDALIDAFKRIRQVYLADGHHRLESARQLLECQERFGLPRYDTITSLYMSTDQLHVEPYDRVVLTDSGRVTEDILSELSRTFHIVDSAGNQPVRPASSGRMGMKLDGQWYHLLVKQQICAGNECLDTEILQKQLLEPVFKIADPKSDSRLICAGGEKALLEIEVMSKANPKAIAFTLCPLTIEQLISAAEEGRVLPPKATWIVPKVPYGLLMHDHDFF